MHSRTALLLLSAILSGNTLRAQQPVPHRDARVRSEVAARENVAEQMEYERALSLAERQSRMTAARAALADYGYLRASLSDQQKQLTPSVNMLRSDIMEAESAPVYFIPADRLAKFGVGQSVFSLLLQTGQRTYPVLSEGRASLAVMIEQGTLEWQPSDYGSAQLAQRIHDAWNGVPGSTGAVSVVRIPALDLEFVAVSASDGLQLIPVQDAPDFGFRSGTRLDAAVTLARLSADARKVRAASR